MYHAVRPADPLMTLVGPGKKTKASSNGKAAAGDAEAALAPILNSLSQELDGQQLTRKAFLNRVKAAIDTAKIDNRLLVPVLSLAKDDDWLKKHADTFDFTLYPEDNTIMFGVPKGA